MKTAKKKLVQDTWAKLHDGMPIGELYEIIHSASDSLTKGSWKAFHLEIETGDNEYYASVSLRGERLETDAEYEKRMKAEQKKKDKFKSDIEIRERQEYERLRTKYET